MAQPTKAQSYDRATRRYFDAGDVFEWNTDQKLEGVRARFEKFAREVTGKKDLTVEFHVRRGRNGDTPDRPVDDMPFGETHPQYEGDFSGGTP